ncbi:MAG TPA: DNA-3-methyladenine glycosylase [Candidatus Binataceae bacterium]|jgi:DNA-3-methyladenine glycosylase II
MATDQVPYARAARAHLSKTDPVLARIIKQVGPLKMARRSERFQALVRAIIFQQLAGAAANAIYGRFVGLFGDAKFPTPAQVLAASDADLRKAGLSAKKALYVKDLATHVANDTLNFHRFARMDDEEIIADLTRVKGVGRWTAEMFLMFNLARADVWPVDDLGVRNAVKLAFRMRERPDAKRLRAMGERWRPYRSAAAWYLWQSLRLTLPDGRPTKVVSRVKRKPGAKPAPARKMSRTAKPAK